MYKKFVSSFLAFSLLGSFLNADLCTECNRHRHHTDNTFAPVIQLIATPCMLTKDTGISFLGELGTRNYRISSTIGGTLGGLLDEMIGQPFLSDQNRFKFGVEFLSQSLKYSFASGQNRRWVNQFSVGAGYQFEFSDCWTCYDWIKTVDFDISYTHGFSRSLKTLGCNAPDISATTQLYRHIAGGDNVHLNLGTTVTPWNTGALFIGADYDYTSYRRKYEHKKNSSGLGATVRLNQTITQNLALEALAEFRRPFNYYEGSISWFTPFNCGGLNIGAYVSYTHGRDRLPNNTTAGLSLEFSFDGGPLFVYNRGTCYNDYFTDESDAPGYGYCDSQLLAWIARPPVYTPTVLAITDQEVVTTIPLTPLVPLFVAPVVTNN